MSADLSGGPESLESLLNDVRACTACLGSLPLGPRPLVQASSSATILIIGQAPGARAHHSGVPFSDESGDRLREWMGLSVEQFYDDELVAIVPMGFCYPGRLGGGDAPPRLECARLWHDRVLALMPQVNLTLLLGAHAQNRVLGPAPVARRVRNFRDYLPWRFPLPHPSWRSRLWEQKNPWFRDDLIPALRSAIERTRQGAQQTDIRRRAVSAGQPGSRDRIAPPPALEFGRS
jgi:uracil-DNA glycosylase